MELSKIAAAHKTCTLLVLEGFMYGTCNNTMILVERETLIERYLRGNGSRLCDTADREQNSSAVYNI